MRTIKKLFSVFLIAIFLLLSVNPVLAGNAGDTAKSNKQSSTVLHIKFAESDDVDLTATGFTSAKGGDLTPVNTLLNSKKVAKKSRLFNAKPDVIKKLRTNLSTSNNTTAPNLNNYYRVVIEQGTDIDQVISELKQMDQVSEAYAEPLPAPSPISSDYTNLQTHFSAAPNGMGITTAGIYPGAMGDSVRIADLEYGWNTAHEDVTDASLVDAMIANGTAVDPWNDTNHGTAVIGILNGDKNTYGVNGIVPNAKLHMVNTNSSEYGWDIPNAILTAQSKLSAGDVLLIEQQTWGPNGHGYVPVEWIPAVYDAIKVATLNGITVVEAAANGSENLDDPIYGSTFPQGKTDSGAIIVGAGTACNGTSVHSRMAFSNYGKRVNVQGYGECVTTTGYGNLSSAADINSWYTNSFNGTSSASALIAGIAGSVASSYEYQKGLVLSPLALRNLLISTGTAQSMITPGSIGPLPNLESALKSFSVIVDTTPPTTPLNLQASLTKDNKVALNWAASTDNSGSVTYKVYRNNVLIGVTGNTTYIDTTVLRRKTYTYKLQAADPSGNVSSFSNAVTTKTR